MVTKKKMRQLEEFAKDLIRKHAKEFSATIKNPENRPCSSFLYSKPLVPFIIYSNYHYQTSKRYEKPAPLQRGTITVLNSKFKLYKNNSPDL